ncbi:MATE family efflux transporter [Pseudidiomarina halophila]|uniref:hypothetical protein n=1 Tax=Pseudidiomarina halophila TaxID=1449799 RepID=UPI00366AAFE9
MKSMSVTVVGRAFSSAINFLVSILLMKYLDPASFGIFVLYTTIVMFASVSTSIGLNNSFLINVQSEGYQKYYNQLIAIKGILFFLLIVIFGGFYWFNGNEVLLAIMVGLSLGPFEAIYLKHQVKLDFKKYAIWLPSKNAFYFLLSAINILLFNASIEESLEIIFFIALPLSMMFYLVNPLRAKSLKIKFDMRLKGFKHLLFQDLVAVISTKFDVWTLSALVALGFISTRELGLYASALTFASVLVIITSSVTSVLLPKDQVVTHQSLGRSILLSCFIGASLLSIYWFFILLISNYYLAETYQEIPLYVVPLLIGTLISLASAFLRVYLLKNGHERFVSLIFGLQLPLMLLILVPLALLWGLLGCLIAFPAFRLAIFLLQGKRILDLRV